MRYAASLTTASASLLLFLTAKITQSAQCNMKRMLCIGVLWLLDPILEAIKNNTNRVEGTVTLQTKETHSQSRIISKNSSDKSEYRPEYQNNVQSRTNCYTVKPGLKICFIQFALEVFISTKVTRISASTLAKKKKKTRPVSLNSHPRFDFQPDSLPVGVSDQQT